MGLMFTNLANELGHHLVHICVQTFFGAAFAKLSAAAALAAVSTFQTWIEDEQFPPGVRFNNYNDIHLIYYNIL